jgi:putative glutamine amidotransferase
MKRRDLLNALIIGILSLALGLSLQAQTPAPERALELLAEKDGNVRLVIFNPETFNIRALAELRRNGTINIPNLTVIGVFHVKQTGDFAASRKYVADHKLDWFKFHAVSAETSEPSLFKKNAFTDEFGLILKKSDGVIFFGGPDIPPSVFGQKTNLLTEITDPYRHWFEASAVFHLLGGYQDEKFVPLLDARPRFPVLGICLGHQTLNVGTGGSLVQDIWTELYQKATVEDVISLGPEQWHNNPYRHLFPLDRLMGYNFHSLELGAKSLFVTAMGFKTSDHPRILSSHHQAVGKLGKGLVAVAFSRDGKIIEAVEHSKYPNVLGIQFHPEHPLLFDPEPRHRQKPDDPPTSFRAILEGTPPSLEFNKAIWGWFAEKLKESHGK